MRIKLLIILGLLGAIFVSLTVGTQSNFATGSTFGVRVEIDTDKIRQQSGKKQPRQAAPLSQQSIKMETSAEEETDKKDKVGAETAQENNVQDSAVQENVEQDNTEQENREEVSPIQDTENIQDTEKP